MLCWALVSTVSVCVWRWVTAPVAPGQRHWSPGDEEIREASPAAHVCLQLPRAHETTRDTTPGHRPGRRGRVATGLKDQLRSWRTSPACLRVLVRNSGKPPTCPGQTEHLDLRLGVA